MDAKPLNVPATRSITLTKWEAATTQVHAAIEALQRGDYAVAITLAGAAEGMLKRRGLFHLMSSHPIALKLHRTKKWFPLVNRELYWLKHGGPIRMEIPRHSAVTMIRRAASKLNPKTPLIENFNAWFVANMSDAIR